MIAIRPEVTDFLIGSSWDYSFVPEMCPSGNVVALTDSDEYLVVEMQPRDHEARHLRWGALRPEYLAKSLAEWTTVGHRRNAQFTVLYHAADAPAAVDVVKREADAFLAEVGRYLTASPQPHRDHPYWFGAIAAHRTGTGQKLTPQEWAFVFGGTATRPRSLARFLWHARRVLYGKIPGVRPWHPRWSDFRLPLAAVRDAVGTAGELLVISDSPYAYSDWLSRSETAGHSLDVNRVLGMADAELSAATRTCTGCLLVISERHIRTAGTVLARVAALLQPPAGVVILVMNDGLSEAADFAASFAYHTAGFLEQSRWVAQASYVSSAPVRWALRRGLAVLADRASTARWYDLPYFVIVGGLMSLVNFLCDAIASRPKLEPPRRGFCSSMLVVLRPNPESSPAHCRADDRSRQSPRPMAMERG